MIDVTEQINAARRTVGSRTLEAGEARIVTVGRTYAAGLDDVWDACTNPERIPRWFLPVTGDLREGGRFQLEGNAGGTIERCEPPTAFRATWEYGGQVSWIERRLTSGETVDPKEVEAWTASDDGVRFVTLASEGWREASVAAGAPEEEARAAADQSTAFYTGAPT